jgi:hypothetical protein
MAPLSPRGIAPLVKNRSKKSAEQEYKIATEFNGDPLSGWNVNSGIGNLNKPETQTEKQSLAFCDIPKTEDTSRGQN